MTMGSHQRPIGKSQQHLTPLWILKPLGRFDLDPCASSPRPWDIGKVNWTEADNGLAQDWFGRAFLNPPFHRYRIAAWLAKMAAHNRGIVLTHARTETDWFRLIKENAAALFFLDRRVIFLDETGNRQIISNPKSKHYGKPANSGAPVLLAAYGGRDADVLAALPASSDEKDTLAGLFIPLIIPRYVLVEALGDASWREIVSSFLSGRGEPVAVADLYRAFAGHPKSKRNPNWKAKLRQTLQRGAGRSVAHDQWVAA
jgi:hypothetical protein